MLSSSTPAPIWRGSMHAGCGQVGWYCTTVQATVKYSTAPVICRCTRWRQ
jgi:hypothetical protein